MAKKSEPKLKGISNALKVVTTGFHNRDIANNLYLAIARSLQKDPFYHIKSVYEHNKEGILANMFGVFAPFDYDSREIDPIETLDQFFDIGDKLYEMVVKGISNSAERIVTGRTIAKDVLPDNFRETLTHGISLSQDIASWAVYQSQRQGLVGTIVRGKLAKLGITNPDYLTQDVQTLGETLLRLYDSK